MATESNAAEQSEAFTETKPKETKTIEEVGSLKRSFEGNSDFQPETKKLAMSSEGGNNDTGNRIAAPKPAPAPIQAASNAPAANNPQGQHITEQIRVPDRMVGLLIGKGGEQITNIQNECQCRIQFAPDTGAPERDCTITGPPAHVQKAMKIIDEIVLKNQLVQLGGDEVYLEMNIPGNKVGLIIGKNGDTIKQLQEKSGVKVAVIQNSTEVSSHGKPLRITGHKLGVQKARDLVMEILSEHDRMVSGLGGGGGGGGGSGGGISSGAGGNARPAFAGPGTGAKINMSIPVPRSLVGIVIGKGGEMIKKIQEDSGAKVQFKSDDIADDGPNRTCHIYGYKTNNDIAVAMIQDLIKHGLNRQNGGMDFGPFRGGPAPFANGTVHTIPSEKCGLVIGKGGENIKEINRSSGAHAELIRDNNADPAIKRFKIQGTPDQIQHCVQLINEKAGLPPLMSGPIYGGIQGPIAPPSVNPFPSLNMPGPAGNMMAPFQGQTQVVLQNPALYGAQVPQSQWASAAAYQQAAPTFNQPQPTATVVVDPSKDQNAAAWAAYYAQVYGGATGGPGQPTANQGIAMSQGGMQTVQAAQVGGPGGGPAMAYTTQVIPAPVQAAAQPQPTINPITGQHDYSLAWAEYYRAQGLHQQAAAIMQGVGMPGTQ